MGIRLQTIWRRRKASAGVCLLLWLLALPADVRADYTYTDGSFGLEITFPNDTAVTRIKSPAGETGTEIGQFTLPDGNTVGRLVVSDLPENWTFEKALDLVREQLAKDSKVEAEKITTDTIKVKGNYKGATLLQAYDEAHNLHNGILIVQGPSDQILLMYMAIRQAKKDEAEKLTRQLAGGFNVLLKPKDEQIVQDAMARGSGLLLGIAVPIPKGDDLWQNKYLLIYGQKEAHGYIVITETAQDRGNRPGLAMKSEKWVFWPKGGAEYELQTAYATWDLHEDEWTSHSETVLDAPPAAPGQPAQPARLVNFDQRVLRLGQQLLIETTDPKDYAKNIGQAVTFVAQVGPTVTVDKDTKFQWVKPYKSETWLLTYGADVRNVAGTSAPAAAAAGGGRRPGAPPAQPAQSAYVLVSGVIRGLATIESNKQFFQAPLLKVSDLVRLRP